MSNERRQYSPQFKLQVVLELLKGEKRAAQIAREHNIGQDLLSRWTELFHERAAQVFHDGRATGMGRPRGSPSWHGSSGSRPSN